MWLGCSSFHLTGFHPTLVCRRRYGNVLRLRHLLFASAPPLPAAPTIVDPAYCICNTPWSRGRLSARRALRHAVLLENMLCYVPSPCCGVRIVVVLVCARNSLELCSDRSESSFGSRAPLQRALLSPEMDTQARRIPGGGHAGFGWLHPRRRARRISGLCLVVVRERHSSCLSHCTLRPPSP